MVKDILNVLQNELSDLLDDVPLQVGGICGTYMTERPLIVHEVLKNWLDANLENRWISRNGPVLWPARSPDLKSLVTFSYGAI
jgi:hypothetical protein